MYLKKMIGYVLPQCYDNIDAGSIECIQKDLFDVFTPATIPSANWKQWVSQNDLKRCQECHDLHGKIFGINDVLPQSPHKNCRCTIEQMEALEAGTGTNEGSDGADWWLKHRKQLPDYYITRKDLINLGWPSSKPPAKYAPGKMMSGGIYKNEDAHLPDAPGRIWYEADINYYSGRRNKHRIYWSNDGLIFVTYNHGSTFYEIV